MSTNERLAQALEALGLDDLAAKARVGAYNDFEGPDPAPTTALVLDLQAAATGPRAAEILALAQRAQIGEFDASAAEAEAWFHREGLSTMFAKNSLGEQHSTEAHRSTPERVDELTIYLRRKGGMWEVNSEGIWEPFPSEDEKGLSADFLRDVLAQALALGGPFLINADTPAGASVLLRAEPRGRRPRRRWRR